MSNEDHRNTEVEAFMIDGLMKVVEAHAARSSTILSSIGMYAARDAKLFKRLKTGGTMTVRQWSRVIQWIYDRWPADEPWPKDVIRPARRNVVIVPPTGRRPRKVHLAVR